MKSTHASYFPGMAFFGRSKAPQFGSASVKAAAGAAGIGQTIGYNYDTSRDRAMTLPVISRARDLIVSLVSSLPINEFTVQWDAASQEYIEMQLPGESWMTRPDPSVTRQFLIAWTVDDMMFHGYSVWYCTARNYEGRPSSFMRLPASGVSFPDQPGTVLTAMPREIIYQGQQLDPRNCVVFLSPIQGLLSMGWRAIEIAHRLDDAAMRFATNEITAGYLQQTDNSEPLDGDELAELASAWQQARKVSAVGALNSSVKWVEFQSDPSKLQLVEARQHAMLSLADVANIPPFLVGAPTNNSMTYTNAQDSQWLLYKYACAPYIQALSERLSMDDILPRGRFCRLDVSEFVDQAETAEQMMNTPSSSDREPQEESQ